MIPPPMASAASNHPIPFSKPSYDERELEAVRKALAVQTTGDGPAGRRVEARLASMLGATRVLLTTSGTHALELALLALGIGRGQEVVCPSFTVVSSANAVLRVGARPVFADVEEETLGLDPADVERRLTARSVGIVPVHYAAVAPDMESLLAIARRRSLRVVEDAAQGIAASWRGRALGTLGDAGCLSFHETKNVSCGEGGALVLRDHDLALRAEVVREKGTNRSAFLRGQVDKYTWVAEGSSYVLSDVLAAILEVQLEKLEAIQARRAAIVARYREGLAGWAAARGVRLPRQLPEREPNHHIFYLLYPDGRLRDEALAALRGRGVMATFHYVPLHSSPFGRTLGEQPPLPVTERVASSLLRLPLHACLSDADVERVIGAVQETGR